MNKYRFSLPSFPLKLIACLLRTLDHIGRLFVSKGTGVDIPLAYYLLRAIGKCAFPVFAFFVREGVYHTSSIKNYLLRLGLCALVRDAFGYFFGFFAGLPVADNPLIGNVFTDLFCGALLVYLLRRKDGYSFLALLPLAYEFLSGFVISSSYGTLTKSDWGAFSILLFLFRYLGRSLYDFRREKKAKERKVPFLARKESQGQLPLMLYEVISRATCYLLFYLFYRLGLYSASFRLLPNEFIPIGTYSLLGTLLLFLYNGKRGPDSKVIRICFYAYYPFHLALLGILSYFFGVLATL